MTTPEMTASPATAAVLEVSPSEALGRQRVGAVLIDVREAGEWAQGSPQGALRISLSQLSDAAARELDSPGVPILTICGSGVRSRTAAERLLAMGFADVRSVAGGFTRWKREGLPFEIVSSLDADACERYSRHLLLPEIGETGQARLMQSLVVLIGAGGLGSPSAYYLAAAGVGRLRLIDHDVVDRSNLQRQILHTDARVGVSKVASAAVALSALNPRVAIDAVAERIDSSNVERLIADADVVIDGSDNFATRYLLNDACVRLDKPLVYGAVHRFEGQVSLFWPASDARLPCYRCLFPEPPSGDAAPNCAEAGVLGLVPGLIGLLQANEAIKVLLRTGETLGGRLLTLDARSTRFREVRLPRDPACPACGANAPRTGPYPDYQRLCAAQSDGE
jgi:sulfur-carrier protein adenylyltransferase/sulfurtransferase